MVILEISTDYRKRLNKLVSALDGGEEREGGIESWIHIICALIGMICSKELTEFNLLDLEGHEKQDADSIQKC